MLWWEMAASIWHFVASMLFLILAIKSRSVSKLLWTRDDKVRRLRLKEVNPGYWFFKCEVYNYFLDEGKDDLAFIVTTVNTSTGRL